MNIYRFGDDPCEYQYIAACTPASATDEYAALFSCADEPSSHQLTEEELDTTMVSVMDKDGTFAGMEQTIREKLHEETDPEDDTPFLLCGADL